MRIGLAGLGRMGAAMAARLSESDHQLTVWNRTPDKARAFAEGGAGVAETPADLARSSDVVITILADDKAMDAVYRGPSGLLSVPVEDKVFIEMSTVLPSVQTALEKEVASKGGAFVECPVGGSVAPARSGSLIGLVGASEEALARARPVLEHLCRRIEHVGPVGAGASIKLAINLPLLVYWQSLGESYALCRHLDIDPARFVDIFADTSGGTNALKARGAAVAQVLRGEDPSPVTFDVDLIVKDLRLMIEEGRVRGMQLPLVERTLAVFEQACRDGWGPRDATTLVGYWASRQTAGGR